MIKAGLRWLGFREITHVYGDFATGALLELHE